MAILEGVGDLTRQDKKLVVMSGMEVLVWYI